MVNSLTGNSGVFLEKRPMALAGVLQQSLLAFVSTVSMDGLMVAGYVLKHYLSNRTWKYMQTRMFYCFYF